METEELKRSSSSSSEQLSSGYKRRTVKLGSLLPQVSNIIQDGNGRTAR
ncbi:hypothetical protein, partial, partial [Absidia glauca]